MVNPNVLEKKKKIVDEITDKIKTSSSIIFFDYRGLTVAEMTELRNKLKKIGAEVKIYKNTLTKKALENLNFQIDDNLIGPNAISFSKDVIESIKVIADYAKEHEKLTIKVGIIEGSISSADVIHNLSTIPSRETLLAMLANGMLGVVRDLALCLNIFCEQKASNENLKEG